MRKGEYRTRAQRLLSGKNIAQDLNTLLLFLREHSYGKDTVRDVGHMLGHSNARAKGLSVERVNDHYSIACFQMPRFANGGFNNQFNLFDMPACLPQALDATFKLIGDEALMRGTGLTRAQASTRLTRLQRKFKKKGDGRLEWSSPNIHVLEIKVIECLISVLTVRPAYDGNEFFNDFSYLLVRHGLIDPDQTKALELRKSAIIAFAVVAMHGVRFRMPDGNEVEAEAGWGCDRDEAFICVSARMSVPGFDVDVAFSLFETDVKAADWCENYDPERRNVSWQVPIELSATGQITTIK